jgi:hypothetical protein
MRIELSGPAKQKLNSLSETHGMTQVAMMSRLIEWFSRQPQHIQAATLAALPKENASEVAKMILQAMASGK